MAHIQDRGKGHERRWQARYRDPSGREVSRTFGRKLDARRWLDEQTADMVTGRYVDPRAGRVRLRAFADRWLAAQTFDASTRESVESRLRVHVYPTLGGLELRAIRPSTVQAWVRGLDVAPSYAHVLLANLSTVLGAAVEDAVIAANPCASKAVRAPRVEVSRVVPWTVEQVQAIADAHSPRWRAVPVTAAGCGLRQGEVFGLHVPDVDFLGRRLLVRRQVKRVRGERIIAPPKGAKTREVPLPELVAVALAERIRAYPPREDGLIFTTNRDTPLDRRTFNANAWKPALRKAGIKPSRDAGMHQLRHHYSSVLLDAGVSIRALADYLGHTDPGFTLRVYSHLMPDSEGRARQAIDAAHALAERSRNEGTAQS